MRAAARVLLPLLATGAALAGAPATAQVSEGIKRPGPVPYVELYGRKPARKPARPKPQPGARAAKSGQSAAPASAKPTPNPADLGARPKLPLPPPPAPSTKTAAASTAISKTIESAAAQASARGPGTPVFVDVGKDGGVRASAGGPPIDPAMLGAFIDGAVAQARASDHAAGVVVSVVQNGQVLVEKGYGEAAPSRPMDPRATLVRLGSVSKVLTWIAALKAVEAGRLKLDAPVDAVLPPPLRPPAEGWKAAVTLRLLMEHAAGFEAREFGRLYLLDPERRAPLDEALRRDRPRRVRAPGELSSYTSYDAALAGALLEASDHHPFSAVVARDVTGPIGMASTTFAEPGPAADGLPAPMPDALAARLAAGQVWTRSGLHPVAFEYARLPPALSASSTADDMGRLMLTVLGGGRSPASGAAVWGPATAQALEGRGGGWREGAGGLMRYPLAGGLEGFGHEGATLGFRATLLVVPALGLGVFVAANSDTGERLVRRLPGAIAARFAPPGPPLATLRTAAPERYAGLYLSTRRAYHGLEGFVDRLTRLYRVRGDGRGGLVVGGRAARVFAPTATPDVFVATDGGGARLRFLPGRADRADTFADPGGFGAADRVGWLHWPAVLAGVSAVALLAALLALAGPLVRGAHDDQRQTPAQAAAVLLQGVTALLWVGAAGVFTVFASRAADPLTLYTRWPDPWLTGASWLALAAALLSLAQIGQVGGVWSEGRRIQGWDGWRKLRHTLTTLSFLALAVVLASWGALEPWSG